MGGVIDQQLREAGCGFMTGTDAIIHSYHQRGADKLVHRAFKDFGFEEWSFQRFVPSAAASPLGGHSRPGENVLKVTATAMASLRFKELWERYVSAPKLVWT